MQRVYFYEVFQGLFGTLLIRNFFTRYFLGLFQEETWSFTFDTQIGLFTLPNEQGVRALSHSRLFVENVDYGWAQKALFDTFGKIINSDGHMCIWAQVAYSQRKFDVHVKVKRCEKSWLHRRLVFLMIEVKFTYNKDLHMVVCVLYLEAFVEVVVCFDFISIDIVEFTNLVKRVLLDLLHSFAKFSIFQ